MRCPHLSPPPISSFHIHLQPPSLNPHRIFASTQTVLFPLKLHFAEHIFFQPTTSIPGRLWAEQWELLKCLPAKGLSHLPQNVSFGHWLNNFLLFGRAILYENIGIHESPAPKMYTCQIEAMTAAIIKCRTELQNWFKGLGQPLYSVNSHIIASVHSTCFRSLKIDQNWSKSLKFLLPHSENNCSAWHLNKTLIFFLKIHKHNAH